MIVVNDEELLRLNTRHGEHMSTTAFLIRDGDVISVYNTGASGSQGVFLSVLRRAGTPSVASLAALRAVKAFQS